MLVHKLCIKLCPENIPQNIGLKLGEGADGEVFELLDDTSKVIKLCVLYETGYRPILEEFKNISNTINHLIYNRYSTYANVYDLKYLGQYSRQVVGSNGQQKYILYYYVMEKLYKLSEDEKKVFHSILSHEDFGINKNYSETKVRKMLSDMARGLDFDAEKVMFFHSNLKKAPISHNDIHVRNIMKDSFGNYKFIDFDRSVLEK